MLVDSVKTEIRRATVADIDDILRIDTQLFPPGVSFDEETFFYYLTNRATITIVAMMGGVVVGFIIFHPESSTTGCVVTIDVELTHQKRGVGSKLMGEVERIAKGAGYASMVLQTEVNNQSAISFYEHRRYRTTNRLHKYYRDETDAWEMVKTL